MKSVFFGWFVRNGRRLLWAGCIFFFLAALAGLLGYLWLPGYAKNRLERELTRSLRRPVSIEGIDISPFRFSASLTGFKAGDVLSLRSLHVRFSPASIFRLIPVISRLDIQEPKLRLVRETADRLNVSDLIEAWQLRPSGPMPEFSISNITLEKGHVEWIDKVIGSTQTVSELSVGVPFIANTPSDVEVFVRPLFSARVNGAPVNAAGKLLPFGAGREASIGFDFRGFDLTQATRYLTMPLTIRKALADARLQIQFKRNRKETPSLIIEGDLTLHHIDVQAGQQSLQLPGLSIAGLRAEPFSNRISIRDIALASPEVTIVRSTKGSYEMGTLSSDSHPDPDSKEGVREWEWSVQKLSLTGGRIHYEDAALKPAVPLNIWEVSLKSGSLSSTKNKGISVDLAARVNDGGSARVVGAVTLAGDADLKLKLDRVDLVALQGWVSERLNVVLTRGNLSFDGIARFAAIKGLLEGNVVLADFNVLDRLNAQDLLRWKSLSLANSKFETAPVSVAVGDVTLEEFYARAFINPDGRLNLKDIVKEGEQAQSRTPRRPAAAPAPIRIGNISLSRGTVDFADKYIKPNYSMRITGLNGRISALKAGTASTVELNGKVDRTAPLEIAGRIDPLAAQLSLDIRGSAKGIDLPSFSSYSGRYMGYGIEKGKLSMDVSYKIRNGELVAENKLFLDQLTLGAKVDSKDAVRLPIRLAVALLKNRRGEIDIDLPVRGSLNDPEFSLSGIIVKVLVNVVTKAVTSPFRLLGSLFGGGKDLSQAAFEAGSTRLTPEMENHLQSLAKAMEDRPGLDLEITGLADPDADAEGIRASILEHRLRAQKLSDQASRGQSGMLSEISLNAGERPIYLAALYRAELAAGRLPKKSGEDMALPMAEMEKQLLAGIPVNEPELLSLAEERGQRVQAWLVNKGNVPPERVFLRMPKIESKGKEGPGHRVQFTLR